jgi:hypothetical protein
MFCLPVPTPIYERFLYFQDRSAYSLAGKYVRSWEYINRSQMRKFPEMAYINGIFVAVYCGERQPGNKYKAGCGYELILEGGS